MKKLIEKIEVDNIFLFEDLQKVKLFTVKKGMSLNHFNRILEIALITGLNNKLDKININTRLLLNINLNETLSEKEIIEAADYINELADLKINKFEIKTFNDLKKIINERRKLKERINFLKNKKELLFEYCQLRFKNSVLLFENLDDIYKYFKDKIDRETFDEIIKLAPDYNPKKDRVGRLGKWLVGAYINSSVSERDSQLNQILHYLEDIKNSYIKYKNLELNRLKNFDDFLKKVEEFKNKPDYYTLQDLYTTLEIPDEEEKQKAYQDMQKKLIQQVKTGKTPLNINKIYEDDEIFVAEPLDEPAACILGRGSKWCFASNSTRNEFRTNYNPDEGYLIIFRNKKDPKKSYAFFSKNYNTDLRETITADFPDRVESTEHYLNSSQDFADYASRIEIPQNLDQRKKDILSTLRLVGLIKSGKEIPKEYFDQLINSPNSRMRKEAAKIKNLSEEDIRKLATDITDYVRIALVKNHKLPEDLIRKLVDDRNYQVRYYVVRNNKLPEDLVRKLINDESWKVRMIVIKRQKVPLDLLKEVVKTEKHYELLTAVYSRKDLPDSFIKDIIKTEDNPFRILPILQERPDLSEEIIREIFSSFDLVSDSTISLVKLPNDVIEKLSNHPLAEIRAALIENQKLSKEIMKKFANDKNQHVKIALAKRNDLPKEVINILANSETPVLIELASNPNLTSDIIRKLFNKKNKYIDHSLISNEKIKIPEDVFKQYFSIYRNYEPLYNRSDFPVDIIREIIKNNETELFKYISLIPTLPEDIIRKLVENSDSVILSNLARNVKLPKDIIEDFLKNDYLKDYLVENPYLPEEIMERLIREKDPSIVGLSDREDLSDDIYRKLSETNLSGVMRNLAGNPKIPDDVVRKLASITSSIIRKTLLTRKNLPEDVIRILTTDPNRMIRSMVFVRSDLPEDLQDYLLESNRINKIQNLLEELIYESLDDLYKNFENKIDRETFNQIIKQAPDYSLRKDRVGKLGRWLINAYIRTPENERDFQLNQVINYLEEIKQSYIKYKNLNLDKLKTFDDFLKEIKRFESKKDYYTIEDLYATLKISDKEERKKAYQDMQSKLIRQVKTGKTPLNIEKIYEDNNVFIAQPLDEPAACILGKGSKWCFASNSINNEFRTNYNPKEGYLIIFRNKKNPDKSFAFFSKNYESNIEDTETADFQDIVEKTTEYLFNDDFLKYVFNMKIPDNLDNTKKIILKSLKDTAFRYNIDFVPIEEVEKLAKDEDFITRLAVASRRKLPEKIIRELADDPNIIVRQRIAERNDLPEDLIRELAKERELALSLSKIRDLPEDVVRKLAELNDTEININLLRYSDLPDDILKKFVQTGEEKLVRELIGFPDLPDEVLEELAVFPDSTMRLLLAYRKDLPENIIVELMDDKDEDVRAAVVARKDFPKYLYYEMSDDKSQDIKKLIAEKPDLPEDLIEKLANDKEKDVRFSIAKREDLPRKIINILINDSDPYVRWAIATKKNLTKKDIDKLLKDPSSIVREAIVRTQDLTENQMKRILKDQYINVLTRLAERKDLPVSILRELANSLNKEIRWKIASKPNLPDDIIKGFVDDPDMVIRNTIFKRKDLSKDIFHYIADKYKDDKFVIITLLENPSLPEDLVKEFSKIDDKRIKQFINKRKNFSESIVEEFLFESLDDIYKYFKDKIDRETFDQIIKQAPDYNEKKDRVGKLGKWLVDAYIKSNKNNRDSQLEDVIKYLKEIQQSYIKYKNLDLNNIKTFDDFLSEIKKFEKRPDYYTVEDLYTTLSIPNRKEREKAYQNMQSKLIKQIKTGKTPLNVNKIYEDSEWYVAQPLDEPAACILGRGSKWCFASNSTENEFRTNYNPDEGLLLIFRNKKDPEKSYAFFSRGYTDEIEKTITADFEDIVEHTKHYLLTFSDLSEVVSKLPNISGREGKVIGKLKDFNLLLQKDLKLPKTFINKILREGTEEEKIYLSRNLHISEDVIRQLAEDENTKVRHSLSERKDLPEDVIRQLAKDDVFLVRLSIAKREDLPEDVIRQLAKNDVFLVRLSIARRNDLPEDVIRLLAQNDMEEIRLIISKKDNLPKDVIEQFLQDKSSIIKGNVVEKGNLSEDLLRKLADSENHLIIYSLIQRSDLPADVIEKLIKKNKNDGRVLYHIFKNEKIHLSKELIEKFLKDRRLHKYISSRPELSEEKIRELAKDEDLWEYLARNPNLPRDLIEEFLNAGYQEDLALNPNLPEDIIWDLIYEDSLSKKDILYNLVLNKKVNEDQLSTIFDLGYDDVNQIIAESERDYSTDFLDYIISHTNDEDILYAVAERKYLPEKIIRELAENEDNVIREAIAGRKDLPEDVVRQLAQDKEESVRKIILSRYNLL